MANRVDADEVKVIINTSLTDTEVTAHIYIANDWVSGVLGSSDLGSTRLRNIELYLSAHFVGLRDQDAGMLEAQWVGSEAKIEYGGNFTEGLKLTRYGQQVLALDTTGSFANLGQKQASFRVV